MADSSLVKKFMQAYSGNYKQNRAAQGGKIKKITIHHFASTMGLDALGKLWQTPGRVGSSHYGVKDGSVYQYVAEKDVAYTDSSWSSNINSVTIETSNSGGAPNWPISDASFETLAQLCADIARRNGLGTLVKGQNLTWHQMYVATACPGPYLLSKMDALVKRANEINQTTTPESEDDDMNIRIYKIVAAYENKEAAFAARKAAAAKSSDPKEFIVTTLGNADYVDGKPRLMTTRMKRQATAATYAQVYAEMEKEAGPNEIIV